MRRLTIALAMALLLLAGCSSEDGNADPESGSGVVDETSTSTLANGSDSDADSDEETGGGSEGGGGAGADGRTSEEILDEDGWLEDGRVFIGPAAPQEEEINLALCDYVVGEPEDIARRLGIDGDLTRDRDSGFGYFGSSGGRLQCLYSVDGVEALFVVVRDSDSEADDETSESVFVQTQLTDDGFGVVMVNPDWDGEITVDESSATEWLKDMGTRWGGTSV